MVGKHVFINAVHSTSQDTSNCITDGTHLKHIQIQNTIGAYYIVAYRPNHKITHFRSNYSLRKEVEDHYSSTGVFRLIVPNPLLRYGESFKHENSFYFMKKITII